ncbi:MAG: M28 family peptidase, partial [Bacteroidota bacterium]|nr:M28 family peptidase [Bacteroidota bacterium]
MKTFNVNTLTMTMAAILLCSCGSGSKKAEAATAENTAEAPAFVADSAWKYTEAQTLFGPRVPNTDAHEACRTYLVNTLKQFGATVTEQQANLKAYDGTVLKSTNIIASFQPEKTARILLCAHWDSRPWADQDPNPSNFKKPVMGANDGASGVGVLMEIARLLGKEGAETSPSVGVDIVLFDSEDYGCPTFYKGPDDDKSWCLGTQYWAKNPHTPGYKAKYGILLDMVGGKAPTFYWDYYTMKYASDVAKKVWDVAANLGYSNMFVPGEGAAITDDHVFVNQLANIPCIDIIDCDPSSQNPFVEYWHTTYDTMAN